MELAAEKWGGLPHYRGEVHVLGDDEHGTWLWGIEGRPIWIGDEVVFHRQLPVVMVVPPGAWWYATWWLGHREVEVYVNINTPAVRDGDVISYVDLDLDVVRTHDGSVEIVDRDELELHRAQLGYPDDLVAAAEAAADEVFERVRRGDPPFDGVAAAAWVRQAEERFRSDP
jgi:protein associated with RNAse G/E